MEAFGPWAEVIDRAWQLGAQQPEHPVSDGDGAIAAGIGLVYGREVPHQLCVFHLLREYRRNIGEAGYAAARRLLNAGNWAERRAIRRKYCGRRGCGVILAGARRRCSRGCVIWRRGRRRIGRRRAWSGTVGSCGGGRKGTVWTEYNLPALLQEQGLSNQTT